MTAQSSIVIEKAELKDLGRLLDQVDCACSVAGVPSSVQFDLRLAVEEICANIILHGYGAESPGRIDLRVEIEGGEAEVEIRDGAAPFDPDSVPPPDLDRPLPERQVGGLGWHLVREVLDEVHHETNPHGGNCYRLVKHFSPVGQNPGEAG